MKMVHTKKRLNPNKNNHNHLQIDSKTVLYTLFYAVFLIKWLQWIFVVLPYNKDE